jgi:Secretion system C-terminal sorting domain
MKKITLLFSVLFGLHQLGFSCDCISYGKTFCDIALSIKEDQIIARIQIESREGLGGQARILQLYKGTEEQEVIQIWGGNGGDCIQGFGRVGEILIVILGRFNQVNKFKPLIKIGDYSMGTDCGNTTLRVENGMISGLLTAKNTYEKMADTDPRNLSFCSSFITNEQELQGIAITPNPTSIDLTIRGLTSEMTISIFDVIGRLLSERMVSASDNNVLVGELSSGIYIIRFRKNTLIKELKFVKI